MALAIFSFVCTVPTHAFQPTTDCAELTFNHFYNYEELETALKKLADVYSHILSLDSIGKSFEGRDLWLMTITNPETGEDVDKPAIYVDGNVHGNEIQASETCLYSIWYLAKSYGHNEKLTELINTRTLYILPSVNPDGRAYWFDSPNNPHSSRTGKKPTDNDRDGLYDEDGPDDLDGDGYITNMWKKDPNGRFVRSQKDPRIFEPVKRDERGEYTMLGWEGIDNDGDGQLNEDGAGGYDMNRNWPSDWQPDYIQFGAGEYPFYYPETAAIGRFLLNHPNVAAVQSYHNAGGMILRGPGVKYREDFYLKEDVEVYDEIGQTGERILPYYRYLIIFKDLYEVHGGFVNWAWEGLGVFSFTNELWSNPQMYYGKEGDWTGPQGPMKFGDLLQFGELFQPYKPFQHPKYGEILIGGWNKYFGRVPPAFMLEELCHRNFAFTMYHADQMPKLSFSRIVVQSVDRRVWRITVEVKNESAIPTISTLAAQKKIGARDSITLAPLAEGAQVLASGRLNSWYDEQMPLTKRAPERIWNDTGIPGHSAVVFRWLVEGEGSVHVEYSSPKGGRLSQSIELKPTTVP